MQKTNIPFRKKINRTILSLALFVILVFLSNYAQINNNSQRMLAKFFEIPQELISEVYEQIAAFETERVVTLEKEIQAYQEKIYQQNLVIEELQNSDFILFDKKNNFGEVFITGFDVVNYKCCQKHRIFITPTFEPSKKVFSVSQGSFAIGKSTNKIFEEYEVALLSDPNEYVSLKTMTGFFCVAKGIGNAQRIQCKNESKLVPFKVGDVFYTTGFDGVYPEGLIVGKLDKIIELQDDVFLQELQILLFFDPYKSINKEVIVHD